MNLCSRHLIFGLFFVFGQMVFLSAQIVRPPVIWGNVPKYEREMTEYPYDKNAPAVILCDWGVWYPVDMPAGIVRMKRHVRLKILHEAGVPYKDIRLVYNKSQGETITELNAQTINFGGGRRKTIPLKLKFLPEKDLGNGMAEKSFVFRDVSPGSIIEYSYSLKTKEVEHLKPWYFQSEIPTVYSEVQLLGFEPYRFDGVSQMLELSPPDDDRWVMKHTPALGKIPFVSSWNDCRIGLRFQLRDMMSVRDEQEEWRLITLDLQQGTLVSDDSAAERAIYSLAQSIVRNAVTEEEKIAAIHAHVRDHVRWNGISDTWVNQSASALYRSRVGNSAEVNMLMAHLLWNVGIPAYRCFVSTRDHGKPNKFPLRNQFNDVFILAKGDGQSFILDATEKDLPYDLPPRRLLNGATWVISDTTAYWSKMPDRFYAETTILSQLTMDDQGAFTGNVENIYKGYAAQDFRRQHAGKPEMKGQENPDLPVSVHPSVSLEGITRMDDNMLIFNPLMDYRKTINPFSEVTRICPLDFENLTKENYILNLEIPETYQVIRMPVSSRISLEGKAMYFEYLCENRNGVIQVRTTFEISQSLIYPEDYAAVKDFYEKMIARMEEEVVMIRKE
ncbi:MAG: DUF3857 domain-containing protein [Bacteroidia bacterium]